MTVKQPYTPVWSGRWLGIFAFLVVVIPIVVAVLLLTRFSVLSDTGEDDAVDLEGLATATGPDGLLQDDPLAAIAPLTTEQPPPDQPEPAAAPEPPAGEQIYTVTAGDTLGNIAARFGTSVGAIAVYNGITNPDALRIGQQIRIPPSDFTPPPQPEEEQPADDGTVETQEPGLTDAGEAEGATAGAEPAPNGTNP